MNNYDWQKEPQRGFNEFWLTVGIMAILYGLLRWLL